MRIAREHVDHAASSANRTPSERQAKAGNYAKGHMVWQGLPITIETPKGAKRSGTGKDGTPWSVTMANHYGYFKKTTGKDGDHVDCYMGPHPLSTQVYVVDQKDADSKRFDEHKVMLGFSNRDAAVEAYRQAFSDGRGDERIGAVTEMPVAAFKRWLARGDTTKPLAR